MVFVVALPALLTSDGRNWKPRWRPLIDRGNIDMVRLGGYSAMSRMGNTLRGACVGPACTEHESGPDYGLLQFTSRSNGYAPNHERQRREFLGSIMLTPPTHQRHDLVPRPGNFALAGIPPSAKRELRRYP
jgi:hypothetical protein